MSRIQFKTRIEAIAARSITAVVNRPIRLTSPYRHAVPGLATSIFALAVLGAFAGSATAQDTPPAGPDNAIGTVNIQGTSAGTQYGANVGANGSSDPGATEGTGSYTTDSSTISSKTPLQLRETPQSVTVITEQRLRDQQLNDVQQVLQQTPGITTVYGSGANDSQLNPTYYSRGFPISSFQIDGGAPISYGSSGNNLAPPSTFTPTFDLSQYDRVEVVRGADGVNVGTGDPGGVISLQRKRPVAGRQIVFDGVLGSYSKQRAVIDVSTPLFVNNLFRLRVVGTHDDSNYFFNSAYIHKDSVYYNLEFDPFEKTQINVGGSVDSQRALPFFGGLPRFAGGADLHLPRSTCPCAPWSLATTHGPTYFVELRQGIVKDWNVAVNLNSISQKSSTDAAGIFTGVGVFPNGSDSYVSGSKSQYSNKQYSADATLNGAFDILGHRQELSVGGNYSTDNNFNPSGDKAGVYYFQNYPSPNAYGTVPNFFTFNPGSIPVQGPGDLTANTTTQVSSNTSQYAAYASLRLSPWDPLHVIISDRYNVYRYDNKSQFSYGGRNTIFGSKSHDNTILFPNLSVTYDIVPKTMTVYGSRNSIYTNQGPNLTANLTSLAPVTGSTYEVGLKRSDFNGTLNSSIAFYTTKQVNLAVQDPAYNFLSPLVQLNPGCCYLASSGSNVSKGIDFEVNGAITSELQVQAGYTFNANHYSPDPQTLARQEKFGINPNKPLISLQPKNLFKVFATYQPAGPALLHNATFGVGVRAQDTTYIKGSVCDKNFRCSNFNFTQNPYAVVDAFLKYDFTKSISGQINVTNLFDKNYYETVGSAAGGNRYGQPRAFTTSLHAVF